MASQATETTEEALGWHRLDRRLVFLHLSGLLPPIAGFGVTAIVTGGDIPARAFWTIAGVGVTFVFLVLSGLVKYFTTRYRLTRERVELHTGLLAKRQLSIPRDRIRSVDLTANPVHRVFGLTVVKVGTGQTTSTDTNELSLDAVTRAHAESLRQELLSRPTETAQPAEATQSAETAEAAAPAADAERSIASMRWSWVRYAPLTMWTLAIAAILVGTAFRVLDAIGVDPFESGLVVAVFDWLKNFSIVLVVVVGLAAVLVVGVIGATLIYVESWWGFRLTRESGVFRVRRGLLTTRSFSLEERRLRGVEVIEPVTMRWAGGAETKAIATGLATSHHDKDREKGKDALLPPAPLSEAHRVTAAVLAEETTPIAVTSLRKHPRAALRRRLVRAIGVPAVLAVILAAASVPIGWLPLWPAYIVFGLIVVTVPLAFDAYKNLGHTLTGRYLVTRYGAVFRRTVGLRRSGVIGWTISRTYFQRRSGLATIAATTGAGGGEYKVRDVELGHGLVFASDAVPDLLRPFLAD